MKICSISENKKSEKRISITPEIAKKYISLGFEVSLIENYGLHLGYDDNQYKELGANIIKDEKELINKSDVIVQLGLLSDDKLIRYMHRYFSAPINNFPENSLNILPS